MMPHALQTESLPVLKAWAVQHYRNEIQDTILHHAPDSFSWDDCDEVEGLSLAEAKRVVATLTPDLLRNVRYVNHLIADAVAETILLLRPPATSMKMAKPKMEKTT